MNLLEKQMVSILQELKERYHVMAVKAEFEAEGTRLEEAMRLKEVSLSAGLGLAIKIGGCEAIKDMFDASSLGARTIIAPMVETPYALKKYLQATRTAFTKEQREDIEFFINVETVTTCQLLPDMLDLPEIEMLDGIVIGRVDLTGSLGLERNQVNGETVKRYALEAVAQAKKRGLKVVIGGGVSYDSLPFFRDFPDEHLDRIETRKIVFRCPDALSNPEACFLRAVEFELLWLKNKKNYYGLIHQEDDARLSMMEDRYRQAIEAVKQNVSRS